jgi:hypothetical protein
MRNEGELESPCGLPRREVSISAYCFGELSDEERYRFEAHLLQCESCWHEIQRLGRAVRCIKADPSVTRSFNSEIISIIGISSRVPKNLFGHGIHAIAASLLYSFALAVTVFMEIAYDYTRFSSFAWATAPLVLLWAFSTTVCALGADAKLTRAGHKSGMFAALSILIVSAVANYIFVRPHLPDYSVTQAVFQTWTAQAAYLKGLVYCGVFCALFLLFPFHFILVAQRELLAGRSRMVYETLTGGKFGIPPRGAPYLGVGILCVFLILGAASSFISTAHLLEGLKPAIYRTFFIETIVVRWLLFLCLGLECCWWYYSSLNELKRESTFGNST